MSNEVSDLITISTSNLSTRKRVQIKDNGVDGGKPHVYTVRKLGAGEEMDLSQIARQQLKLLEKIDNGDFSEKDSKLFDELKKQQLELYIKTFDDGGDGSKSRALILSLSDAERNEVYNQVFPKTNLQVLLESELEEGNVDNGDTNS